ncbi:hypothetical protein VTL71DRAFT_14970 [Oculimacula yallundae]|uniref:Uncharacterized protein n=1 Tax=Oculimacula yallundae TaxID=86028 RepID=A0ABR4CHG3_9HELO
MGFEPSLRPAIRHCVIRLGTLILKTLSFGITVFLNILLTFGLSFSGLVRVVRFRFSSIFNTTFEHIRSYFEHHTAPDQIHGETSVADRFGGQNVGGINGLPEGWVRYMICRTEDISELDLERCEGCRQVLETEIEMFSKPGNTADEGVQMEKQERIDGWLGNIEKVDADSGYSSPDADRQLKGVSGVPLENENWVSSVSL